VARRAAAAHSQGTKSCTRNATDPRCNVQHTTRCNSPSVQRIVAQVIERLAEGTHATADDNDADEIGFAPPVSAPNRVHHTAMHTAECGPEVRGWMRACVYASTRGCHSACEQACVHACGGSSLWIGCRRTGATCMSAWSAYALASLRCTMQPIRNTHHFTSRHTNEQKPPQPLQRCAIPIPICNVHLNLLAVGDCDRPMHVPLQPPQQTFAIGPPILRALLETCAT